MREEDNNFLQQAAEALINESQSTEIDPTINELLKRLNLLRSNQLEVLDLNSGSDVPRSCNGYLSKVLDLLKQEQSNELTHTVLESGRKDDGLLDSKSIHTNNIKLEDILSIKDTNNTYKKRNSLNPNPMEERPYKCSDCHLAFFRSSDLRRHEKIHLPVLPNICPQCSKGFARKDALKRNFNTLTCRRNRNKLLSLQKLDPKTTRLPN